MIQVRQLGKSFGCVQAVRNLSFDAPNGAITGLLGPNGAGKTTTLRMMAGVMRPSSGTVRIGDASLHEDGAGARQGLGALLDGRGLYARLTAREHLVYFGRLRGLPRATAAERAEHVLSALGLAAMADRRVSAFSQGERMKVSLGCALVHEPGHLLLDEPTNGLDVPTVRSLRNVLKRLRDGGACIIFSSHVLSEVEELCDRVIVITRGAVAAQGTPDDVREQTGTRTLEDAFVALTGAGGTMSC